MTALLRQQLQEATDDASRFQSALRRAEVDRDRWREAAHGWEAQTDREVRFRDETLEERDKLRQALNDILATADVLGDNWAVALAKDALR